MIHNLEFVMRNCGIACGDELKTVGDAEDAAPYSCNFSRFLL